MEMILGKHFAKKAVGIVGGRVPGYATASVGVCLVGLTSKGRFRLEKAKVRVSGPMDNLKAIDRMAEQIAQQLDEGTYKGPKTVRLKLENC